MDPISIASFNMNRGMRTPERRDHFQSWLTDEQPGLLLLQEPWSENVPACDIPDYEPLYRSPLVACYASRPIHREMSPSATVCNERWVQVSLGGIQVHNVYLDDKSPQARRDLLNLIASRLDPVTSHCILGDFNMSPRDVDGLYGGKVSKWTRRYERESLQELLRMGRLVDLFVKQMPTEQEFSFERMNRGQLTQFRCDLALVDQLLSQKATCRMRFAHEARIGPNAFTDHSGIVVTVEV